MKEVHAIGKKQEESALREAAADPSSAKDKAQAKQRSGSAKAKHTKKAWERPEQHR